MIPLYSIFNWKYQNFHLFSFLMESTETQHLFSHRTSAWSRHPAWFWHTRPEEGLEDRITGPLSDANCWSCYKDGGVWEDVYCCLFLIICLVSLPLLSIIPHTTAILFHPRLCLSCSSLLGPAAPLCIVHPCVQRCRVWWRLCRTKGFACSRSVRNVCRTASTCGAMQPRYRISTICGQIDAQRLALVYHMSFFWGTDTTSC